MCSGIELDGEMHLWTDPEVRLPVVRKDGECTWLGWGERHGAKDSPFHEGPCARLESIRAGRWRRFDPRPVKIRCERYMERDRKGRPYWVRLDPGQHLQGMVATWHEARRVYVVTVEVPDEYRHVQPRWPRVLAAP